ncbi:hypothetical protein VIGAN_04336300 [Vigna angularis var. angularis]|uniref:Uncharacterized protein n=1 Tax=Vigna angularis var. angularis TaxID=157739 RepID=A0A0S3RZ20_PHAAN|nr:hypothetical protein VIGAN_04336300 [Vigna angularis var. angularis]
MSQLQLWWNCIVVWLFYINTELDRSWKQLGGDTTGKVALDSELSTGGFTGCLLHYGASHVYGVGIGYGQVTC